MHKRVRFFSAKKKQEVDIVLLNVGFVSFVNGWNV